MNEAKLKEKRKPGPSLSELLKTDVSELKLSGRGKLEAGQPLKTTINLAMREEKTTPAAKAAAFAIAAVLILAVAVKFGVVDQFSALKTAQAGYAGAQSQYQQITGELSGYSAVEKEYMQYSKSWEKDAGSPDYVGVDRTDVLDMLERDMMSAGTVKSVTVQGENMVVGMAGMNLSQISAMFSKLSAEPIVKNLELTIAETENRSNSSALDFSVTFVLKPAGEAQG